MQLEHEQIKEKYGPLNYKFYIFYNDDTKTDDEENKKYEWCKNNLKGDWSIYKWTIALVDTRDKILYKLTWC